MLILASFGTVVSTAVVGTGFWEAAALLARPIPFALALVFGALISPTDPIAVLSVLKNFHVPPSPEVEIQGEALFNDGIAAVLFTILLSFALGGGKHASPSSIVSLLLFEAGGGLLLGVVTGYLAYWSMRLIHDYLVEVMITLGLATEPTRSPRSSISAGRCRW